MGAELPLKQAPHVTTQHAAAPSGLAHRGAAGAVALRLAILVGHTLPGRVRIVFSALSSAGAEALLTKVFIASR